MGLDFGTAMNGRTHLLFSIYYFGVGMESGRNHS